MSKTKTPMNNYTFRDLKAELEKLTEEQLDHRVVVQREDTALRVCGLDILEDDIWYHKDNEEEDRATLKDLRELHGDDFNEADYLPGPKKGTPFLWEEI